MGVETYQSRAASGVGGGTRAPLEIGRIVAGKYRIEALLGQGGMGAVYLARNLRTRKDWALKVLYPEMGARPDVLLRFLAEAQAAGVIGHPGIVEIIDQDRDGDLHFLVMPKLDGEELASRIARCHPLAVDFVMRIGADVADAIEAAHRAKIIHRDLKPQNIFLAEQDGRHDVVQILDFGIAKLMDDENLLHGLTQTQEIYGTPHYMSPEQLRSAKDVDERTDVYAIGVILYQALAGRTPYLAETFPDLVVRIMTEEPTPLKMLRPDVPPALDAIIKRAMAREHAARFSTSAALRDALLTCLGAGNSQQEALAQTLPATEPVLPARRPAQGTGRRTALKWGLGVAAGSGLAVAGSRLLGRHLSPAPPPTAPVKPLAGIRSTAATNPASSVQTTIAARGGSPPIPIGEAPPPTATLPPSDSVPSTKRAALERRTRTHSTNPRTDLDLPPLRPR